MAKGQKRGNREVKKPKQDKKSKPAESPFAVQPGLASKGPKQRPGG